MTASEHLDRMDAAASEGDYVAAREHAVAALEASRDGEWPGFEEARRRVLELEFQSNLKK